jgi:hypothetical protein
MAESNFNDPLSPLSPASDTGGSPQAADSFHHPPTAGTSHALPKGATVYTPTSAPSVDLNPRSCVTCRRRKVRCDKHMPCANCRRAQIPCVFPAPERAPRRPRRKDPNTLKGTAGEREMELIKRLRKLEGIVEELSGQIEVETSRHHSSSGGSPEVAGAPASNPGSGSVSGASNAGQHSPSPGYTASGAPIRSVRHTYGAQPKDVAQSFGRLVLNDNGRSRYVSSAFWSKINDEVSI